MIFGTSLAATRAGCIQRGEAGVTKQIAACLILSVQVAAAATESELHVTVRLRNYSEVPNKTLMEAEREAAWVLREAGIASEWLDCSITPGQPDPSAPCKAPIGPADLSINILSGQMMRHLGLQPETLGAAMLPPTRAEAFAVEAVVCSSRVRDFVM